MLNINEGKIKKILGKKKYEEVKEFFSQFILADCNYKVLLTRRSYILYKIFLNIISKEKGGAVKIKGKIFNTHSAGLIPRGVNKVLICDDIIVNGRTMKDVVKKLEKEGVEKIPIWCLQCNSEAAFLGLFEKNICHAEFVQPYEWELLSDKLTDVIIASTVGYVSFVDTYEISRESYEYISTNINGVASTIKTKSKKIASSFQVECFYINCNLVENSVKEAFGIEPLLRFYKSDERALAIPFVFLPAIKEEDLLEYCRNLSKKFNFSMPKYFFDRCNAKTDDYLCLLYEWITNRLSKAIFEKFCSDHIGGKNGAGFIECVVDVNETFAFAQDIMDSYSEESVEYQYLGFKSIKYSNKDMRDTKNWFQTDLTTDKESGLDLYLARMRREDDSRARAKQDRCFGLFSKDAFEVMSGQEPQVELSTLAKLILQCDEGKFSYIIAPFDVVSSQGEHAICVGGFFRHGEQAFRALYLAYPNEFEVIYTFFDKTRETRKESIRDFVFFYSKKENNNRIVDFFNTIDFENFYADFKTVTLKSIGKETRNIEVQNAVTEYINTFYRP